MIHVRHVDRAAPASIVLGRFYVGRNARGALNVCNLQVPQSEYRTPIHRLLRGPYVPRGKHSDFYKEWTIPVPSFPR